MQLKYAFIIVIIGERRVAHGESIKPQMHIQYIYIYIYSQAVGMC